MSGFSINCCIVRVCCCRDPDEFVLFCCDDDDDSQSDSESENAVGLEPLLGRARSEQTQQEQLEPWQQALNLRIMQGPVADVVLDDEYYSNYVNKWQPEHIKPEATQQQLLLELTQLYARERHHITAEIFHCLMGRYEYLLDHCSLAMRRRLVVQYEQFRFLYHRYEADSAVAHGQCYDQYLVRARDQSYSLTARRAAYRQALRRCVDYALKISLSQEYNQFLLSTDEQWCLMWPSAVPLTQQQQQPEEVEDDTCVLF
jgi:hypothetical protein